MQKIICGAGLFKGRIGPGYWQCLLSVPSCFWFTVGVTEQGPWDLGGWVGGVGEDFSPKSFDLVPL